MDIKLYQNKKPLFTDPIFSEGFDIKYMMQATLVKIDSNTTFNLADFQPF